MNELEVLKVNYKVLEDSYIDYSERMSWAITTAYELLCKYEVKKAKELLAGVIESIY